jgi:type IV secretory pathway TraG/TraD family ATPase VirD4
MARTWDGAVLVAESMVQAARPGANRGESSHWTERSSALLSVMLHAGALAERPLSDVLGAIDRHDPDETRAALARNGADRALDLLEGIVATDGREQSGIWSTTSGVLAGYRTDAALATAKCDLVDPIALLNSRSTLYICADSDYQRQAAPLVAGLVRQMRSAAYQASANATLQPFGQAQAREGVSPRPPLLLVLDELANIAPLHDLPTLIAEGGSQGVVTLACLQDLSQARARWGDQADGFLSLFGTKLVFPGIGDTRTLQAISVLAGETQVPTISITRGGRQGTLDRLRRPTSRTVSVRKDRVLPPDAIAQGRHGHVLGIEGARPGFMRTTPWYETSPWREATTLSREEVRERQSPTNRVEAASRSQLGTPQRSIGHR